MPFQPAVGLMNNSKEAAKKSASAKSLSKVKERGAKDAPTEPKHLTNKTSRRMQKSAPDAVMRLQKVVTLPTEKENDKYYLNQTVLTFSAMSSPPNVGGSKSSKRGKKKRAHSEIECVTTDPKGFGKEQQLQLYKNGMLNFALEQYEKDKENGTVPNVPSTPDNVAKITSREQLDEHRANKASKRDKANNEQTAEQVEASLGGQVKHHKRGSWS